MWKGTFYMVSLVVVTICGIIHKLTFQPEIISLGSVTILILSILGPLNTTLFLQLNISNINGKCECRLPKLDSNLVSKIILTFNCFVSDCNLIFFYVWFLFPVLCFTSFAFPVLREFFLVDCKVIIRLSISKQCFLFWQKLHWS